MKCLDTPLLEDLLIGRARAKRWLSALGKTEGEVSATEVSFAELAQKAMALGRGAERRLMALQSLRRELTVLPFDAEAARAAVRILSHSGRKDGQVLEAMVAGTAVAKGASHLFTDGKRHSPKEVAPLKLVRF